MKRIKATLAALAAAALLLVSFAGPAHAAYWGSSHKPKSWICSVFNVCHTVTHCQYGKPNLAYTTTPPLYCHTDRY